MTCVVVAVVARAYVARRQEQEVGDGHAVYSGIRRFSVAVSDDVTLPQ